MSDEKSLMTELEEVGAEPVEIPRPAVIEHIDGQEKLIPDEPVWHGAEELRKYLVPIDSLKDHEKNPRRGDVAAISSSLERFGQVRPILYDGDTIVAGHHVRKAARLLEWTHVAAIPHSFDDEALRLLYLEVDNRLGTLGEYEAKQQTENLEWLAAAGYAEAEAQMGWDIDARETLQDQAGLTPTQQATEWEETAGESPEAAAARAAAVAQYEQHREVVLLLSYPEQYEEFGKHVRTLMAAYGTTGTVATIARAVGEAAAAVAAREVPSDEA